MTIQLIPFADALHSLLVLSPVHFGVWFAGFAKTAAPIAIDALWQGGFIAVALVLCLRFAPRVSASHRFVLWTSAFAVVASLPFLPIAAHSFSRGAAALSPGLAVASSKPWLQLDSRWGVLVAGLWLLASALRAADLVFHSLRLRKLWRSALPIAVDVNLRSRLAAVFPTRRAIEICTTRELDRPSVIGFFSPRILIPEWLLERLTPGELEHIALHELEHLRRRDDWTNLIQKLLLVLFPLNPALAWIERRLCREREMACDEGVVERTQAPRAYAACLTSLAERSLQRRAQMLSLGAFGRRPELVHRVHSILRRGRVLHPFAARVWIGAVGSAMLFGALQMARCPEMVGFVAEHPATALQASAVANTLRPIPASIAVASLGVRHPQTAATIPARVSYASEKHAGNQFRAIETKAIMAPAKGAPGIQTRSMANSEPLIASADHPSRERDPRAEEQDLRAVEMSGAPRQVLLKSERPDSAASSAQAPEQKVILLTAWEQIQTVPRNNRQIADYDAGDPQAAANAAKQNSAVPATQITVTRMILTVYPVRPAPAKSGEPAKSSNAQSSHSGESAAVPFDGGWLVFEL